MQNTIFLNYLIKKVFISLTYIRFKLSLHNLACLRTHQSNGIVCVVLNKFSTKLTRFFFDEFWDRATSHTRNIAQRLCFLNLSVLRMPGDRLGIENGGLLILTASSQGELFLKPLSPIKLLDSILRGARLTR